MKNLFKSKKGFTLVEIVIVIAIIGLLMIILIPSAINAFKSNQLQGAKIKAQRVAQAIEAGVGSGKVPLTEPNADNIGAKYEGKDFLCNGTAGETNVKEISNVVGLENIYNLPSENDDLVDPLSKGVAAADNYFRYYWVEGTGHTADAPVIKVFIVNSVNAAKDTAKAAGSDEVADGLVIYANTSDAMRNPVYKAAAPDDGE